jgi:hypothetical protein
MWWKYYELMYENEKNETLKLFHEWNEGTKQKDGGVTLTMISTFVNVIVYPQPNNMVIKKHALYFKKI